MKLIAIWKNFRFIGRNRYSAQWFCTLCHKPCWTIYSGIWETISGTPICDCKEVRDA